MGLGAVIALVVSGMGVSLPEVLLAADAGRLPALVRRSAWKFARRILTSPMVTPGLERRSPTKFDGSGTAIHRYHLSVSQSVLCSYRHALSYVLTTGVV